MHEPLGRRLSRRRPRPAALMRLENTSRGRNSSMTLESGSFISWTLTNKIWTLGCSKSDRDVGLATRLLDLPKTEIYASGWPGSNQENVLTLLRHQPENNKSKILASFFFSSASTM